MIAVIALLAALLLPWLTGAHDRARRIQCVNKLKQSGLAFRIWADDNGNHYPMADPMALGGTKEFNTGADTFRHFQDMSNELSTPKILVCPADTRTAALNFFRLKNENLGYFVGLDANELNPQRFLYGDRNITGAGAPANGILKLIPGGVVTWTTAMHNHQGNLGLADGSVPQLSIAASMRRCKNPAILPTLGAFPCRNKTAYPPPEPLKNLYNLTALGVNWREREPQRLPRTIRGL